MWGSVFVVFRCHSLSVVLQEHVEKIKGRVFVCLLSHVAKIMQSELVLIDCECKQSNSVCWTMYAAPVHHELCYFATMGALVQ